MVKFWVGLWRFGSWTSCFGNRSIVCDPNIADMKDILNSKVKFREWYRPFAPFCKKEDAHKYFESRNFDNLEYMSYAPLVKK